MKRFALVLILACLALAASATDTVTVTYTVALADTTPPLKPPQASATVTYASAASPSYLYIPQVPAYDSTTGVLTWTLPQSCQARIVVANTYPPINGIYAFGTEATYSLNTIAREQAPAQAPSFIVNYPPYTGGTGAFTLAYKITGAYFGSTGYPTASLPTGAGGDFTYDSTTHWFKGHNGTAWTPFDYVTTATSPLVRTVNAFSIPAASSSVNGYLSSADWSTFNGKQAAGSYLTVETDPLVYSWAKAATKPTYTASEVGAIATGGETDPRLPAHSTTGNVLTSNGSAWTSAAPAADSDTLETVAARGASAGTAIDATRVVETTRYDPDNLRSATAGMGGWPAGSAANAGDCEFGGGAICTSWEWLKLTDGTTDTAPGNIVWTRAGYMLVDNADSAKNGYLLKASTIGTGNFDIAASLSCTMGVRTTQYVGICVLDTDGAGAGGGYALLIDPLSAQYFQLSYGAIASYSTIPTTATTTGFYERPRFLRLKRDTGVVYPAVSFDGVIWHGTPSVAMTADVTKIGLIYSLSADGSAVFPMTFAVDWFRVSAP